MASCHSGFVEMWGARLTTSALIRNCLAPEVTRCAAIPLTVNRMTARARIDQDHLIAQLERHDDKPHRRLIVGKTGSAQRDLDLFDADIPDHALPQRSITHAIDQREDFNVADLVFAEWLRDGLLGVSRVDKPNRLAESKRSISTGCAKCQVPARDIEHRSALPLTERTSVEGVRCTTSEACGTRKRRDRTLQGLRIEIKIY